MDIATIFRSEHGMLEVDKLIRLIELEEEKLEAIQLSSDKLYEISEMLDSEVEYLYFDPNGGIHPFCYWDELYYFRFSSLKLEYLQMSLGMSNDYTFVNQFIDSRKRFYDLIEIEDWEGAISFCDKKVSFLVFEKLRNDIKPAEKQKELFLEVYQRNEYGFNKLSPSMVKEALSHPTPSEYDILNHKIESIEDGYVRIFRGQTEQSTPLDKTYSWTLKPETAEFFATRFGSNGKVIKASVHIDDIQAYLTGRGEEEVLVFPEHIQLID